MAALLTKLVQHVLVGENRQFRTQYHIDHSVPYAHNLLPFHTGKLGWSCLSSVHIQVLAKHRRGFVDHRNVYCNASPSMAAVPGLDKVDFMKLQNGSYLDSFVDDERSDIRGVAVAGVEGEPVTLTEPVTEAIAAAFAGWLLEKKKDLQKPLKVSVGHDSRISAQMLQNAVSCGIAGAGLEIIQYGLASTPAMFNSTLTEAESFYCPTDGAITITGLCACCNQDQEQGMTADRNKLLLSHNSIAV